MKSLCTNKGVSTLIATAIFIILFMTSTLTLSLIFNNYIEYFEAVREEGEFLISKMSEKLILTFKNSSGLLLVEVYNPTANPIIITQVWSNHTYQLGNWIVPSQSNLTIVTNLNYTYNCKLITSRGNIFTTEAPPMSVGRWYVQWYNVSGGVFTERLGESYWYELSFERTNIYYLNLSDIGFNATARIIALGPEITITLFLKNWTDNARVIIGGMDSGWMSGPHVYPVKLSTSPGSVHTLTLLFRGKCPLGISFNVINADFYTGK
ncbi:MAG: hypothetical protein NZ922_03850 [Candidatus Methanomethyliaceae archaeon]|nr:hypothetical protein [Candidatus Methanomethyliaceae archaeon]MDW7971206.1 hypothetical protein [Nitrososphaerota archaeon]